MIGERADLVARLNLDGNFAARLKANQSALGRFQGSLGRTGRGVGQIATGLGRAGLIIGGAVVTGLAGATKAAIDFEDAFAGVRKTVDEAELAAAGLTFEDLALKFREMATEIPIAATELARLGETAGALGVHVQDIDDFVRVTALLGETTDLSADQAAEALGKVGTILGLTGKQYEHFADVLVNLGNKGASTESEILEVAKRFAGVGRQAGLTNEQILALASTITSLGAEPEAGGSALARLFSNISTEIANATAKGKAFAKLTGDSIDELKTRINQGDALGIFRETIEGLAKLSRTEQASVLKALGITNVRDRDAIIKMANDTKVLDKNLQTASDSANALSIEATKRFDTTRSKLILLGNTAKELGITFGIEVLPAIKRAAKELTDVLKDPQVKGQAQQLGKDIAKAIDEIDWKKVVDGAKGFMGTLKSALEFALLIIKALDKLPGEVKAAGAGFLVLNKLSGGLLGAGVGNVVGGLAETAIRGLGSRIPGVGRFFAQPVFVTNWPLGGLGGGGGVGGAAGKPGFFGRAAGGLGAALGGGTALGVAGILASAGVLVAGLVAVQKGIIEPKLQQEAGENISDVQAVIATGDLNQMNAALNGINTSVGSLTGIEKILYDLDANGVKTHTESLKGALTQAIAAAGGRIGPNASGSPDERNENYLATIAKNTANLQPLPDDITKKQKRHFDILREGIEDVRIKAASDAQKAAARETATKVGVGLAKAAIVAKQQTTGSAVVSGAHSDRNAIVSAIERNRPIVTVNVSATSYRTTTVVKSGGNTHRSSSPYGSGPGGPPPEP